MAVSGPEIVVLLGVVAGSLFWLWMVRDCLENARLSSNERFYWIALMAIAHVLGATSYWLNRNRTGRSPALSQR